MKDPEVIIIINTMLVSLMGLSLSILSFFFKDVYRDYKRLSEQVHTLHREVSTNIRLFHELIQLTQKETELNREKIEQIQRVTPKAPSRVETD